MNIDEKDTIDLSDGNSYIVAKKINYNNSNYYCIVDINDDENIKFLYEKDNKLLEVEDGEIFDNVLYEMSKDVDYKMLLQILKNRVVEEINEQ